ncbi:LOG family protein [Xylophilus sp. ASV27]|uniref:LOG family protein n=1 Tax=Xylophilus sp. ASV27 TaxID=2795129 RepID=UPI0018ED5D49|nr:TIGR00730 family Rossman fold protein [Xylophilus sp. ASV27]
MDNTHNLNDRRIADAWAQLQAHADSGTPLQADAYRLAFSDPEFLVRRETRGIRLQLEMLKPDIEQQAQGIDNTVVVYGSARFLPLDEAEALLAAAEATGDADAVAAARLKVKNAHYYEQARIFAGLVATDSLARPREERLYICTGGGPGIMEAANRGAHEAGALTVGLNIALPHEQSGNRFITPSLSFKFHYFALRKMHFMMRAKALVAFPGGFGTLDELFELLTLVQTKKSRQVPIVLFGRSFWSRLIHFDVLVEEGTIAAADLKLFHLTDDPQDAWDYIQAFYRL